MKWTTSVVCKFISNRKMNIMLLAAKLNGPLFPHYIASYMVCILRNFGTRSNGTRTQSDSVPYRWPKKVLSVSCVNVIKLKHQHHLAIYNIQWWSFCCNIAWLKSDIFFGSAHINRCNGRYFWHSLLTLLICYYQKSHIYCHPRFFLTKIFLCLSSAYCFV